MKAILITLYTLCILNSTAAQFLAKPEILIPFYFEDAKQNKDTVYVVIDSTASNSFNFDTKYGEKNINQYKWKAPMEARLSAHTSYFNPSPSLFKIRATYGSCNNKLTNGLPIMSSENVLCFHCKNFPLKMTWDTSRFNDICLSNSCIHRSYSNAQKSYNQYRRYLKNLNGEFIMTRNFFNDKDKSYLTDDYISAWGDSIFTLQLFIYSKGYDGEDVFFYDSKDKSEDYAIIYPNPVTSVLTIKFKEETDFKENTDIEIFNTQGQLQKQQTINPSTKQVEIDLADLLNGLYFMRFRSSSGIIQTAKFVKIE